MPAPIEIPKIDIFRGLTQAQLDELLGWMKVIEAPPDRMLFREGGKANGLYLLLEGDVAVMKQSERGSFRLNEMTAPSFFGEISLLIDVPRSTGIRAITAVRVGILPRELFLQKLEEDNRIALVLTVNLAKLLSQRLAQGNEQMELLTARTRARELGRRYRESHV